MKKPWDDTIADEQKPKKPITQEKVAEIKGAFAEVSESELKALLPLPKDRRPR